MTRPRFPTVDAAAYHALPTEAEMREAIEGAVKLKGGRLWRVPDTRDCPALVDLWDLSILVPGGAFLLELKSNGRPFESLEQERVAALLAGVRTIVSGVVRPNPRRGEYSYDEIMDILKGI